MSFAGSFTRCISVTCSFVFSAFLVCFRSGGPEVISESDRCHSERRCVVASHRGSHHQQSRRKRLRPLVAQFIHLMFLFQLDKIILFSSSPYMTHHFYSPSLHKVLFTEQPETYYKWDNWPPESDRKWVIKTQFFPTDIHHRCLTELFKMYSSASSFASALRCLCWRTHWCAFWSSDCHVICPWAQLTPWSWQITWSRGLLECSQMVC